MASQLLEKEEEAFPGNLGSRFGFIIGRLSFSARSLLGKVEWNRGSEPRLAVPASVQDLALDQCCETTRAQNHRP